MVGLWITGATFLLGFHAFQNGFPFLYPDTGTYISSGFTGKVPIDRPIFYGFFLRHISLAESPWLVAMTQNALLAWLIWLTVARYARAERAGYYFLGAVFVLVMTTQVAYFSNLLIPDIFTAIAFLTAFHLLDWEAHGWPRRVFLMVLLSFALMTHLSHFPTMFATLAACGAVAWWLRKRRPAPFKRLHVAILVAVVLLSYIAVPLTNAAVDGKFRYAAGSSVFMTNRLRDLDLLKEFLDEACPTEDWKLCPYKDELYGDFLWATEYSPLYKIGGWDANFDEFSRMNKRILLHPGRMARFLRAAGEEGLRQLFQFQVPGAWALDEKSSAGGAIKIFFPHSLRGMLASRQIHNEVEFKDLNRRQVWIVLGSMALLLLIGVDRRRFLRLPADLRWLLTGLVFYTWANATVCAAGSNIDARYMSRVAWLIPLLAMVVVMHYLERHDLPGRLAARLRKPEPGTEA